jgi:hypothetical protein
MIELRQQSKSWLKANTSAHQKPFIALKAKKYAIYQQSVTIFVTPGLIHAL